MEATPFPSQLPADRAETAIAPAEPLWAEHQVLCEAARCLYCFNAPCAQACPAGVDVAEFIRSIRSGAWRSAARLVLSANSLSETCGCVCPVETLCVGACTLRHLEGQAPIAIHRLQRFVAHWARDREIELFARQRSSGKSIALVGAGPASLACAHELARLGHRAVVFEATALPGGLGTDAIAPYKVHADLALAEARWLLRAGVELRLGAAVGSEITFESLEGEFDAVFLGVGLGSDARLSIPGKDATPVVGAIELLRALKTRAPALPLRWKRALCVGGGNSAIDAALTLKQLGVPEVVLIYRRAEDQMKGHAREWSAAKLAGVSGVFLTQPIAILAHEGRVTGLRCVCMRPGPPDESGRPRSLVIPGTEHQIAGDAVVVAVGRAGARGLLPGLPADIRFRGVRIDVAPETGATTRAGYYAGGDCANGGAEVVNAAAEGMRAARAIDRYLAAGHSLRAGAPSNEV